MNAMNKILPLFFLSLFTIFSFLFFLELRIWILGDIITSKIIEINKVDDDQYRLKYWIEPRSVLKYVDINRNTYNKLKDESHFRILYLDDDEIIHLQLKSRNNWFGLILGMLIFGFMSIKSIQKFWR